MSLFVVTVTLAAVITACAWYFRNRAARWRSVLRIGLGVGAARAGLGCLGWYVVERTSGALQIPAFALSLLTLPEAALVAGRPGGRVSGGYYATLSLALVADTILLVGLAALLAGVGRRRG